MDRDECNRINVIQSTLGSTKSEKRNRFIVYAAQPTNLDYVRDMHKHMQIKHSDATHIIVVYRLPGLNKAYDEDYIEDGEHGAGCRLLRLLVKKNLKPIVLVAVRYYSGVKLRPWRFEIYEDLAEDAIDELNQELGTTSKLNRLQCAPSTSTVKPRCAPNLQSNRGAHFP